jgi:hypothetical protein
VIEISVIMVSPSPFRGDHDLRNMITAKDDGGIMITAKDDGT